MKSSQIQVVFAGIISCDVAEAISLVSFSSTSSPPFFNVPMTLLNAEKAAAPSRFFEQWETLRAITAGRAVCIQAVMPARKNKANPSPWSRPWRSLSAVSRRHS